MPDWSPKPQRLWRPEQKRETVWVPVPECALVPGDAESWQVVDLVPKFAATRGPEPVHST